MSDCSQAARDRIAIYLAALRKQLVGLPGADVEDIVQELRGHIAERMAERCYAAASRQRR